MGILLGKVMLLMMVLAMVLSLINVMVMGVPMKTRHHCRI